MTFRFTRTLSLLTVFSAFILSSCIPGNSVRINTASRDIQLASYDIYSQFGPSLSGYDNQTVRTGGNSFAVVVIDGIDSCRINHYNDSLQLLWSQRFERAAGTDYPVLVSFAGRISAISLMYNHNPASGNLMYSFAWRQMAATDGKTIFSRTLFKPVELRPNRFFIRVSPDSSRVMAGFYTDPATDPVSEKQSYTVYYSLIENNVQTIALDSLTIGLRAEDADLPLPALHLNNAGALYVAQHYRENERLNFSVRKYDTRTKGHIELSSSLADSALPDDDLFPVNTKLILLPDDRLMLASANRSGSTLENISLHTYDFARRTAEVSASLNISEDVADSLSEHRSYSLDYFEIATLDRFQNGRTLVGLEYHRSSSGGTISMPGGMGGMGGMRGSVSAPSHTAGALLLFCFESDGRPAWYRPIYKKSSSDPGQYPMSFATADSLKLIYPNKLGGLLELATGFRYHSVDIQSGEMTTIDLPFDLESSRTLLHHKMILWPSERNVIFFAEESSSIKIIRVALPD